MSSKPIISLRGVDKTYRAYKHPIQRLISRLSNGHLGKYKEFHALNGVSFDIYRGETVGIIGRNGAGKSTLLQIICGIRQATVGDVNVRGHISALLELGSGFQPEFTGRENVFLQGAIIGISQQEMEKRFSDIAEFADIGEYIDQPVKTYSSGMFVRLAFAVATAVNAEIIVIDEALAVGDVAFQARCFNRIRQLKEKGTTIILVSHSMSQILNNADRVMFIDNGTLVTFTKNIKSAVAQYEARIRNTLRTSKMPENLASKDNHQSIAEKSDSYAHADLKIRAIEHVRTDLHENRFGSFEALISRLEVTQDGSPTTSLVPQRKVILKFVVDSSRDFSDVVLGVSIRLPGTADLWGDNNLLAEWPLALHAGETRIEYAFDFPFANGEYLMYCGLAAFESGERVELDQRWPMEKLVSVADRTQLGCIFAPITVRTVSAEV